MRLTAWLSYTWIILSLSGGVAQAYDPSAGPVVANEVPAAMVGTGITEHTGDRLDLSTPFVADNGEAVTLGRYFNGDKPVLFSIVYYNCSSLCNLHLNGVTEGLKGIKWSAGQEFELVALSMDPREGPAVAGPKKASYVAEYGRPAAIDGWHFLTGTKENIDRVAKQIGFAYRWDEASQQYAHASAAVIVTPGGVISRYLHGINPSAQNLRLSLIEASGGKIGTIIDQIVMFCFRFDPLRSKYTLYSWNLMRVGAGLTLMVVAALLIPIWYRERRPRTL